jgi:hypothetical protein
MLETVQKRSCHLLLPLPTFSLSDDLHFIDSAWRFFQLLIKDIYFGILDSRLTSGSWLRRFGGGESPIVN